MSLNLSILTKDELNTRKFWRKCFLVIYSLIIFCALLWGVIFLNFLEGTPYQLGAATAEGAFFVFLPAFIFYHFAYKKAGTCLLTLYVYLKPIDVLIKGLIIFSHPFPYNKILFVTMFFMAVFFYTLNWKLRKVNKKLRLNVIYPEEFVLATGAFEKSASQDTLDSVYPSLVQRWPQFEKHLTHLYKQRLQELNK